MNATARKNILILDPERDVGELFTRALESRKNCKCYFASGEDEAIDLLKDIPFGVMLVDMGAAMAGDFSLLKRLRRLSPDALIIVSAYLHQKQSVNRAMTLGASGYIIKPIKVELLRQKIDELTPTRATGIV